MKDIRFSKKKVDDSWKDTIEQHNDDTGTINTHADTQTKKSAERSDTTNRKENQTEQPTRQKSSEERMPLNFSSFVSSLGMQALLHMGFIPNPLTQKKEENLDAAREIIDIIAILEEKTKGNLTNEENNFISKLLHDLRIQYIEKTK